ncbi:MAG: ATP-binding protein, partial [Thermoleophilia bacterium]
MLPGTIGRLGGLRARLVVLLLLAVLPAVLFAVDAMVDARRSAVLDAQEKSAQAAGSLCIYAEHPITRARKVLSVVAVASFVRHGSPEEISDFLADVHAENPELSSLLVTGPEGRVIAGSVALPSLPDLSDRDYVRQVQETHAFSVGSYSVGRATGKPILTMGQPILAEDGSLLGVVVTGIELEVLGSFVHSADLPDGASFSVVDRNGTVLVHHPDPRRWIGETVVNSALGELMLAGASGSSEFSGPDGVTRLYSYAPVPGAEGAVFASVGIPRSVAYASASAIILQFAAGLALVVLFVTLAAWLGADALVLRPLTRLVTAARGLGGGDLSVRVGINGGSGEIGQLARTFDSMAETIEQRTEALAEAEASYRTMVESLPVGMIVHREGRIVFANDAVARIVGASSPVEYVGAPVLEFVHPYSRDLVSRDIQEIPHTVGASPLQEVKLLQIDGTEVDVEVMSIPMVFGEVPALSTVIIDVSGRKLAEKTLRESQERTLGAQRLEAVGQLAGGIAHDFNNLLTAIIGYAEIGQVQCTGDPVLDEAFAEIRASADRAAALTRQLLAFSRQQPLQPQVVDLNEVTESISGLLRRLIGEDVELTLRCRDGLWPAEVDPGQIEQIIANLAINARDAMPGGGKLTIETANVELGEDFASTHAEAEPGPYVMLAVSDTGTGIDPDTLRRIFEPFFTTKEHGKGTGLGLSTVYGIVKQSGGTIYVYSELGQGTTFKIYFPRVDRPIDWTPERRPTERDRVERGNETILVVEDEPAVRALTARILEGAGYTVLHAGDPADAVKLF